MAGVRILSAITVLLLAWLIFAGARGRRSGDLVAGKLIDSMVPEQTGCRSDIPSPSNLRKRGESFDRNLERERVS